MYTHIESETNNNKHISSNSIANNKLNIFKNNKNNKKRKHKIEYDYRSIQGLINDLLKYDSAIWIKL